MKTVILMQTDFINGKLSQPKIDEIIKTFQEYGGSVYAGEQDKDGNAIEVSNYDQLILWIEDIIVTHSLYPCDIIFEKLDNGNLKVSIHKEGKGVSQEWDRFHIIMKNNTVN